MIKVLTEIIEEADDHNSFAELYIQLVNFKERLQHEKTM